MFHPQLYSQMTSISIKTLFLLIFSSLTTIGFSQRGGDELDGGGDGKGGTIDPGGVGIVATSIGDGHIEGNQRWLIDLSSDGSDYVQSVSGDLTGSTLAINIISEPLANSILIYQATSGSGNITDAGGTTSIGQFATVTGLPDGYGVSYVQNEVYLVNLSVPEVSTILPLMGMLLPWFWSRRRR